MLWASAFCRQNLSRPGFPRAVAYHPEEYLCWSLSQYCWPYYRHDVRLNICYQKSRSIDAWNDSYCGCDCSALTAFTIMIQEPCSPKAKQHTCNHEVSGLTLGKVGK